MQLKKLFAGIAAAATLLGGMALGTATANAAGPTDIGNHDIWVYSSYGNSGDDFKVPGDDGQLRTREFKYVKVADYANDNATAEGNALSTPAGLDQTLVRNALKAAFDGKDITVPETGDPMAWLGTLTSGMNKGNWGAFNDTLLAGSPALSDVTPTYYGDNTMSSSLLTFTFDTPGLYVIVDQDGDYTVPNPQDDNANCTITYHQIKPILAGTKLSGAMYNGIWQATGYFTLNKVDQKSTATSECFAGDIAFNSVDESNKALAGAKYQLSTVNKDGATVYAKFTLKDGKYVYAGTTTDAKDESTIVVSGADGKVTTSGLAKAEYTVTETAAPEGYAETVNGKNVLPKFALNVKPLFDGAVAVVYEYGAIEGGDPAGYVTISADKQTATVKNQKKSVITQLPLTGAAGIALFTVVAAALLGAGAFGAVRMRRQASAGRSVRA